MSLRIVGKCCPIGLPNSYNETLLPGSLDKWLATKPVIRMKWMHKEPIGWWRNFTLANGWLYGEGELTSETHIKKLKLEKLAQLSISWCDTEELQEYEEAYRQRDHFALFLSELNNAQMSREARFKGDGVFAPRTADCAEIDEVSIVDTGAFKNTEFWQQEKK